MKKMIVTAVGAAISAMMAMANVPMPSEATLSALDKGVVAIVHFGLNTFTGREWGYGDTPASVFNPPKLDAAQWVAAAKAGGIRRIILVCKHHDGFCLWPSKYNKDYTVANTPWKDSKGDLVKEVRDAALAAGLEFGVYLSPWDRHQAEYARGEYTEYFHSQWAELLQDYGPISEIWLDSANGGDGWYGGAKETRKIPAAPIYYDHPRLFKAICAAYPLCTIFGMDTDRTLRWPGNESGSVPEDYDLVHNGVFQPPEADTPLRGKWFWHPDDQAKSLKELTDRYLESVGRSGILDLGLAPNRDGLIDEGDARRLKEFGDWVGMFNKQDLLEGVKCVVSKNSRKWNWSIPEKRRFDALDLREDLRNGLRVKSWKAFADGKEIASGKQIGYRRIVRLASAVTASDVSIELESEGAAAIQLSLRVIPPQSAAAMPHDKVLVASHRADWKLAPENSLAALENAIRYGVDIVETDVRRTKDGQLIILHDPHVARVTNGQGYVADMTLEEIKRLNLRDALGQTTAEKIPTLEEYMLAAKGRVRLYLDKAGQDGGALVPQILELAKKCGTLEETVFVLDWPYAKAREVFGDNLEKVIYCPVIEDKTANLESYVDEWLAHCNPFAFQFRFATTDTRTFALLPKVLAGGSRAFVAATWYNHTAGHDDRASLMGAPEYGWGWLVERGFTILETNFPREMKSWLAAESK